MQTPTGLKVVLATEDDILKIISLLSTPKIDQSFVPPLSCRNISIEERVRSKFPNGFWLIALYEDEIVGCRGCKGCVDTENRIVEFSTTAISPAFQGKGLGSQLLRRAAEIAIKRYNPATMRFDSWSTNLAMEKAALKAGFKKGRIYDDYSKRPPGVKSVEYIRHCSIL